MKTMRCEDVLPKIDDHVHRDLGPAEALAVGFHLEGCVGCATQERQARRADATLDLLRGDDAFAVIDEVRLSTVRNRVLATIRTEAATPRTSPFQMFGWAFAAALVALLGAGVMLTPASRPAARVPAATAAAVQADPAVDVVTIATREGVTLRWQGEGSYVVLKSQRPSSFERAQATVVCGRSWTDRDGASGMAYYRVVRAHEPCQG